MVTVLRNSRIGPSTQSSLMFTYAHAVVAKANFFTEKMIAKLTDGQMDLYDGHFKYT